MLIYVNMLNCDYTSHTHLISEKRTFDDST